VSERAGCRKIVDVGQIRSLYAATVTLRRKPCAFAFDRDLEGVHERDSLFKPVSGFGMGSARLSAAVYALILVICFFLEIGVAEQKCGNICGPSRNKQHAEYRDH
jgi:hypothetical protein